MARTSRDVRLWPFAILSVLYGPVARSPSKGHDTRSSRFYAPLACINLASPAGVASGGAQPRLIKAEGSATNEPDSRW